MWRWHELLPVRDAAHIVSLGEGDTPLLALPEIGRQLGLEHLLIKEESFNPTGTFKARGMAAAVSRARELKAERLIVPSAGNAGGALAAYAARAGIPCAVYIPKDTPAANIAEIQLMATETVLVEGLISDAARFAQIRSQEGGWFDLSTFKEPYRLEGKKILGYEIAEALGWQLPDVIVYPTGGGTGLVGMVKAFHELASLGWLESSRLPRMVAVQAEGCAPVVRAFELGAEACEFWTDAHTIASGLRVPKSFADRLILRSIRETDGTAVAVSDDEITLVAEKAGAERGNICLPGRRGDDSRAARLAGARLAGSG